jgi:hypothetical protein
LVGDGGEDLQGLAVLAPALAKGFPVHCKPGNR